MITAVETSVAAYLTAQLAAASLGFPAAASATVSAVPLPQDRPVILAKIEDLPQEVPGAELWTARLVLFVRVPADVTAIVVAAQLPVLEKLITDAFVASALAALAAHFTGGIECTGLARVGWKPGRESTSFMPHLAVTLALHY